ncbi:hypothetical protein FA10DRAFT_303322 [Acaromyces ingoldii]|uniref:Uncharacterized protein n=1 Tax=Acaromyces ingoldii TaxID=215250 RepID=A0A316YI96_9BASI|nr:hypothetical protein FA10DRAFT_303322 [Acaromyces ingoldii]PWN88348.1 hypothetical protein FA10DRAFT_303322 [Acaromyces ingoldii]
MVSTLAELDVLSDKERLKALVTFLRHEAKESTTFEDLLKMDMAPRDVKVIIQSARRLDWTTQGLQHVLSDDSPMPVNSDIEKGLVISFGKLWRHHSTCLPLIVWLEEGAEKGEEPSNTGEQAARALRDILWGLSGPQRRLLATLLAKLPASSGDRRTQIVETLISDAMLGREPPVSFALYQRLLPSCSAAVAVDLSTKAGPLRTPLIIPSTWVALARRHPERLAEFVVSYYRNGRPRQKALNHSVQHHVIPALLRIHNVKSTSSNFTVGQQFLLNLVDAQSKVLLTDRPISGSLQSRVSLPSVQDVTKRLDDLSKVVVFGMGSTRRRGRPGERPETERSMQVFDIGLDLFVQMLKKTEQQSSSHTHFQGWNVHGDERKHSGMPNTCKLLKTSILRWSQLSSKGKHLQARDSLIALSTYMDPIMWSLSKRRTALCGALVLVPRQMRWDLIKDLNAPHVSKEKELMNVNDQIDLSFLGDEAGRKRPLSIDPLSKLDVATARTLLAQTKRTLGQAALYTCMQMRGCNSLHQSEPYGLASTDLRAGYNCLNHSRESTFGNGLMTRTQFVNDILQRALCPFLAAHESDEDAKTWQANVAFEMVHSGPDAQSSVKALEMLVKAWWIRQREGKEEESQDVLAYIDELFRTRSKSEAVRGHVRTVTLLLALTLGDVDIFEKAWTTMLNSCKRDRVPRVMNLVCADSILMSTALVESMALLLPPEFMHRCLCFLLDDYLVVRKREPDFVKFEEEWILAFLHRILQRRVQYVVTRMSEEEAMAKAAALLDPIKDLIVNVELRSLTAGKGVNTEWTQRDSQSQSVSEKSLTKVSCPKYIGSWLDSLVAHAGPTSVDTWTFQLILLNSKAQWSDVPMVDLDRFAPRLSAQIDQLILRASASYPMQEMRADIFALRLQWCHGEAQRVDLFSRIWKDAEGNGAARRTIVDELVNGNFLSGSTVGRRDLWKDFEEVWGGLFGSGYMSLAELLSEKRVEPGSITSTNRELEETEEEAVGLAKKLFELMADTKGSPVALGRQQMELAWNEGMGNLSEELRARLEKKSEEMACWILAPKDTSSTSIDIKGRGAQSYTRGNGRGSGRGGPGRGRSRNSNLAARRMPSGHARGAALEGDRYSFTDFELRADKNLRKGVLRPVDIEIMLEIVEGAMEDKTLRDEVLPFAQKLLRLLSRSKEPYRALPRAQKTIEDPEMSAYHRHVPLRSEVMRILPKNWSIRWFYSILEIVSDRAHTQKLLAKAGKQPTTPLVKITSFKAIVEAVQRLAVLSPSDKVQLYLRCMHLSSHVDVVSGCVKAIAGMLLSGQDYERCQSVLLDIVHHRAIQWTSASDKSTYALEPFNAQDCREVVEDILMTGRSDDPKINRSYLEQIVDPLLENIYRQNLKANHDALRTLGVALEELNEGTKKSLEVISIPHRLLPKLEGQELAAASLSAGRELHSLLKLTELSQYSRRWVLKHTGWRMRRLFSFRSDDHHPPKEQDIARNKILQWSRDRGSLSSAPLLAALVAAIGSLSASIDEEDLSEEDEADNGWQRGGLEPLLKVIERVGQGYLDCEDQEMFILWTDQLVKLASASIGWPMYKQHLEPILERFLNRCQAESMKTDVHASMWNSITLRLQWLNSVDWAQFNEGSSLGTIPNAIVAWFKKAYEGPGSSDFIRTQQLTSALAINLDHTLASLVPGRRKRHPSTAFQEQVLALGEELITKAQPTTERDRKGRDLRHLIGAVVLDWFLLYHLADTQNATRKRFIQFCKAQWTDEKDAAWCLLWKNAFSIDSDDEEEGDEKIKASNHMHKARRFGPYGRQL